MGGTGDGSINLPHLKQAGGTIQRVSHDLAGLFFGWAFVGAGLRIDLSTPCYRLVVSRIDYPHRIRTY